MRSGGRHCPLASSGSRCPGCWRIICPYGIWRRRCPWLQDLPRLCEGAQRMTTGEVTALVLAGQRHGTDPVAAVAGLLHKALLPVAGGSMLLRVLTAPRATPGIGRIVDRETVGDARRPGRPGGLGGCHPARLWSQLGAQRSSRLRGVWRAVADHHGGPCPVDASRGDARAEISRDGGCGSRRPCAEGDSPRRVSGKPAHLKAPSRWRLQRLQSVPSEPA